MPHPQAARLQIRSVVVWLKPWFSTLGSEAPNSKVKEARMYKVLKEICDDKEKMREHEMEAFTFFWCMCVRDIRSYLRLPTVQVNVSGAVKSKGAGEVLHESLQVFTEDLAASTTTVAPDGKIKLPKRKKVLTAEQEVDKTVVTQFKKMLADDSKLSSCITDLMKVPHSTELAESMLKHKATIKAGIAEFDSSTKVENVTLEMKQQAVQQAQLCMKPIQADIKEANRRIKLAGIIKPTKPQDSDTGVEARS